MKTSVINFKVDPKDKKQAQSLAKKLGFSLSSVMKAYLKDFLRKERIEVGISEGERELSDWAKKEIRKSKEDVKKGYVSPAFKTVDEELAWLNDPKAKYENGHSVQ